MTRGHHLTAGYAISIVLFAALAGLPMPAGAGDLAVLTVEQLEPGVLDVSWQSKRPLPRPKPKVIVDVRGSAGGEFVTYRRGAASLREKSFRYYAEEEGLVTVRLRVMRRKTVLESIEQSVEVAFSTPPEDAEPSDDEVRDVPPPTALEDGQRLCLQSSLTALLARLNEERVGLPQLELHPQLAWAARDLAIYAALYGSTCGRTDSLARSGYRSCNWDMQAHAAVRTADEFVDQMLMDDRREFVLNAGMRYAGLACIEEADGGMIWAIYLGDRW